MNTQTLRIALSAALLAGTTFAGFAQAASLATLDTVQVRPAADQIAQQTLERSSDIRTLAAVQVRPSAEQLAEQAGPRVVTLAAVQVRPSAEQRAELVVRSGAATARSASGQAAAAIGALMGQVMVNLPVPQLQPSPAELEALVSAAARL
ncbi:hypothetical protein BJD12_13730 [Xanthomonas vesicatoria ATCC 35937]|uniref:Uncharacterized protein n=1 Tax=Xanthomonas vesicatoria ATCC 35937 TaxID=925775 RepID=F0BGP8_9XANT|nr:hypothetical protein [Xanthomonas vesicatoria]APP76107.1 hypothetical protein BJD12_13730 [Xanthomonas vesicatoria ATCC 35937]EGD08364.1 hypothetical protein XVE_3425 [Xanthomonas vesicatoria ATCC 35937]KTF30887.1 hypothetical protein LMG920_18040 [Xanthomonas vesicatoria]MCC8597722.1 hypothetical protein [Xanthomonas vesicatoria]MCC8603747.1 hypothetical protein [Xanthomonas vesicatoria]